MKKKLSLFLAAIVALVIVAPAAGAAVRRVATYEPAVEAAPSAIFKGGPVRVGSETYLHSNDGHAVVGVTSMELVDCSIVLNLDHQPGHRVMSAVVDEDETISRLGVVAGISGGNAKATIRMWKDGERVCPRDPRFGTTSNLWVSIVTITAPPVRR